MSPTRTTAAILALVGLGVAGGACSAGSSTSQSTASALAHTATTKPLVHIGSFNAAVLYGRPSALGTILSAPVLSATVYSNVHDTTQGSACSGSCATSWAPLTSGGAPLAAGGINPALLGTIVRPDGRRQVTYGGHPLYTYAGDKQRLGLTGQGVDGSWFVLSPSGQFVRGTA